MNMTHSECLERPQLEIISERGQESWSKRLHLQILMWYLIHNKCSASRMWKQLVSWPSSLVPTGSPNLSPFLNSFPRTGSIWEGDWGGWLMDTAREEVFFVPPEGMWESRGSQEMKSQFLPLLWKELSACLGCQTRYLEQTPLPHPNLLCPGHVAWSQRALGMCHWISQSTGLGNCLLSSV